MNKPFHHMTLGVKNIEKSREFYQAVIETLGHSIYTAGEKEFFVDDILITQSRRPSRRVKLAFQAENPALVKLFHDTALRVGGICKKAPVENIKEGLYETVVVDPDGNNIQALYRQVRSIRV